jgi:formate-dependent phosphoribosylglycinamide formyltransferase (GAR transformylase)
MNIVMLSPGYPAEMVYFTRALAAVGATVIGVGDQPPSALPQPARDALAHYEHVSLTDENAVLTALYGLNRHAGIDQVECLWEPYMILAARIREAFGLPGMTVEQTVPFRDKERMKQALDAAGIRTPRHVSATTVAGVWEAAERIGCPLIVKPIDGAGSADTYRINSADELNDVLPQLRHVPEVSVEEFIDGEEFTFDTICVDGEILYHNVSYYRPRPLAFRSTEWISPMTYCLRDVTDARLAGGVKMGQEVLKALDFRTGFTHMEWYLKTNGEAVFGEIAARPPGANTVDLMNFASDIDLFTGYAEAELTGKFTQPVTRPYNAVNVFKRAMGTGRIQRIEGLEDLKRRFGPHIAHIDLLPVGAPRRDWVQTLVSDGYVVLRHPDLSVLMQMADAVASDLKLYAG